MKKLMLTLLTLSTLIFLVGTVNALLIDNVQSYDKEKREYTITNAFGIPLISKDIAKIKLTSNLIEIVPIGYEKVAEFNMENYDDYINVFNDMEFFNLKDNNKILTRNFDYKYKTIVQVPNYENVCNDFLSLNGTLHQDCNLIEKGTKDKIVWEEINKATGLLKGNITIGIFTNVQRRDKVEWIPTLFGERLDEWAIWEDGGLKVGLVSYYPLNETSGAVVDSLGNYSGINYGGVQGVSGIINNSYYFNGSLNIIANFTTNYKVGTKSWTVSLWVNTTNMSQGGAFFEIGGTNTGVAIGIGGTTMDNFGNTLIGLYNGLGWIDTNVEIGTGFRHIVVTINDTGDSNYWINGSNVYNDTQFSMIAPFAFAKIGGSDDGSARYFHGEVDEVGIWNRTLTPTEIISLFGEGAGCTYENEICGATPTITLNSPVNVFNTTNQTVNFNATIVDNFGVKNVSLFIDGVRNETNSSEINNTNYLFTKKFDFGSHNWSYEACNDIDGCRISSTRNFTISSFVENSKTFNASSFETAQERFTMNITTNGSTPTSAKLIYDGTTYSSATITSLGGNDYNISRVIIIPLVNKTKSFFFNITVDGVESSSSTQNQIINLTYFTICNETYITPFVNYTFKDETDSSILNATIPGSTFTYYLNDISVNKSFTYSNANLNYNYTFCGTPNRTMNVEYNLQYASTGYPQRIHEETKTYNNTLTTKIFYLLGTANGIYVTFQVVNQADEPLENVDANATRSISSSDELVGIGSTGADGGITFWLNPDFLHAFDFFKSGYDLYSTSIFPTQSSYTVTLGQTTQNTTSYDYNRGIKYTTTPTRNSLDNDTIYNFSFVLTSSYWDVTEFGFILINSSSETINSTSSSTNGGSINVMHNTGNETKISMNYYWVINNTYNNATKNWVIYSTAGTEWSIATFFTHLDSYVGIGFFGLDNFGLALISFIMIFIFAGVFSYKYGLTSPATIMGIVFTITLFLNVGVDIIPTGKTEALRLFPSIIIGLLFVGALYREVTR